MAGRVLRTLLSAVVVSLAFSAPAGAVQWVGKFDPLDVFGQGLFQYGNDPSCTGPGTHLFDEVCDPLILALTATVTDDNGTTDTTSDDSHAFLDFAAVLPDTLLSYVIDSEGNLAKVTTDFIGFVFPTSCDGTNTSLCGPWWFQWDAVNMYLGFCNFEDGGCSFNPDVPTVQAFTIVFTQVPEPATLALIVGGIGAGWFARRRKRAT